VFTFWAAETQREVVSYEDALLLWCDMVYTPAVHDIKESGAMERFPDRTEADLFIWMWRHQQKLIEQYTSNPVRRVVEAVSSLSDGPVLGSNVCEDE
jgi:hypothetical protein